MNAHELLSFRILGGLLWGKLSDFQVVAYEQGIKPYHFPKATWGDLYIAIAERHKRNELITPDLFTGFVPESDLYAMQQDGLYGNDLRLGCISLVRESQRTKVIEETGRASKEAAMGGDPEAVIASLFKRLADTRGGQNKPSSVRDIRLEIDADINDGRKTQAFACGIPAIDKMFGGKLRQNRVTVVGGIQKARKTSLIRNIYLGLTRSILEGKWTLRGLPISLSMMNLENDRRSTWYDYFAMMCAEVMFLEGTIRNRETISTSAGNVFRLLSNRLAAEPLEQAYESGAWRKFPGDLPRIVETALERMDAMPLHIYDRKAKTGGLSDWASVERCIRAHNAIELKPGHIHMMCLDYVGLVRPTGNETEYATITNAMTGIMDLTMSEEMSSFVISQYNRDGKKASADDQYAAPQSKGSSAPEEQCHTYGESRYDSAKSLTRYNFAIKQGRRVGTDNSGAEFVIHPSTGLILNDRYNDEDFKP